MASPVVPGMPSMVTWNGCSLAGKDQKPAVRQVHREINQDVDSIIADDAGELLIGAAGNLAPDIGLSPAPFGHRVRPACRVEADDLERFPIVKRQ